MLAVIELGAAMSQKPRRPEPTLLDQIFLGASVNLDDLHPRAREFFATTVHDLEEVNKVILLRL
jgi:hypothetical protein